MKSKGMNRGHYLDAVIISLLAANGISNAQYLDFHYDGLTRQFIYHAPENIPKGAPLVFVLHGYTDDAVDIRRYSGMDSIADRNGFAVCYPRGTVDDRGNRFWNVGYSFHPGMNVDDVEFLTKLAGYLQNKHDLSTKNTFVTGMSNGGEMCYLLACRAHQVFRAYAPVAGMMLQKIFNECDPEISVPLFEIHGTSDTINFYEGDISNYYGWGSYPGIPYTIDFWSRLNECTGLTIDTLPDKCHTDNSIVVTEKRIGKDNDTQIWLYRIINGGHDWPGSTGNMDINASREIWSFFSLYILR